MKNTLSLRPIVKLSIRTEVSDNISKNVDQINDVKFTKLRHGGRQI